MAYLFTFISLSACINNVVVEPYPKTLDLTAINACVSILRENKSGLIEIPSGNLIKGYQQARMGNCSHCYYISVAFGDFLNPSPVDPSYISDKRAPSCSVDKETLEVVYLVAPKGPNSMELVEYVEPNLPLAEQRYNKLVELSEKEPHTVVHNVERIYSYLQGNGKRAQRKSTDQLI